jgi:formylglycine-generating enzyme required for sulfatase activity
VTAPSQPAPRVFVSHSHQDNDFGGRLVQDLRRALGGDETAVWYDVAGGLRGGDAWWRKIVEEITARPIFIVVLSPDAMASRWVNDEIDLAWQQKNSPEGKLIVPILHRDCQVRPDLRTRQIISFAGSSSYDSAFTQLLTALGGATASAPTPSPEPTAMSVPIPAVDTATTLVRQLAPQIEAAFEAHDWLAVIDKTDFLARRNASIAIPSSLYYMHGRALLAENDPARAIVAFDSALALNPLDVAALFSAATARVLLGRRADALTLYQDALAVASSPTEFIDILNAYIAALIEEKQWPEALRRCDELLRLAPDELSALTAKLQALTALNCDADALTLLRQLTARPVDATFDWHWLLQRARLARVVADDDAEVAAALDAAARLAGSNDSKVLSTRIELSPIPPDRFPPRLVPLGFIPRKAHGVEYIVPPVCDVPAGEFLMGSDPKRDREANDDEQPQHHVTLPAFQIARFPVTVAEYACFVRTGYSKPSKGSGYADVDWPTQLTRLDHPVTRVSWHDAVAYAAWLSECSGQPWRLPSEAEWEKAARGTDGRIYPWGNTFDKARCNTRKSGIKATTPVDRYPGGASPCGALDLTGNVWEKTASVFEPYPYTPSAGREAPEATGDRVLRGGCWDNPVEVVRAAYRYRSQVGLDGLNGLVGFRLLRTVAGS